MKKIINVFCVFILFALSINFTFAQEYQIYVSDIDVTKVEYQVGDTVEGSFKLSNLSELPQSDIYYTISSGSYSEDLMGLLEIMNTTEKKGPYYIKGQSQETIPFTYVLPKSITGSAAIEITATLKDGTLVGQYNHPISIIGDVNEEKISVVDSSLTISGFDGIIDPRTGPTVYNGESIDFNYVFNPVNTAMVLTPVLKLYDRTDNPDALKKTVELDSIEVGEEASAYSVSLPTDLDPLVYYGVLTFKNNNGEEITSTNFRYIVGGLIATVRNITTEDLEVDSGDTISAVVTYGGQPLDEYRPEMQINSASTTITVVARNEKGEDVATVTQLLNLSNEEKIITIPMTAQKSAKSISFFATIQTSDGAILDEYSTTLPSKEDVKNQQSVFGTNEFTLITIISIIVLIIIIGAVLLLKKKYSKLNIPTVVFLGIFLALGMIFGLNQAIAGMSSSAEKYLNDVAGWDDIFLDQAIMGWRVLQASTKSEDFTTAGGFLLEAYPSFKITSVSSPLPPILKSYNPGEKFYLKFNAVYGDCNNKSKQYYAFAYASDSKWWTKKPELAKGDDGTTGIVERLGYWQKEGKNFLPDVRLGDSLATILDVLGQNLNLSDMIGITEEKETAIKRLTNNSALKAYCTKYVQQKFSFCEEWKVSLMLDSSGYFSFADESPTSGNPLYPFSAFSESKMIAFIKAKSDSIEKVRDILLTAPGDPLLNSGLKNFDFASKNKLKDSYKDQYTKEYAQSAYKLNQILVDYTTPALSKLRKTDYIDDGEHDYSVLHLDMQRVYTAPTEPGYHRVYFYINQYGNMGYKDMTAVQLICVRGKGVCPDENQNPPVADIKLVDQVTTKSARVNWTYSDKDGDKQIQYQIQVSTDKTFKNTALIKTVWSGRGDTLENKDIRNHVITGLKANTTYFVRMKVKSNAKKDPIWSVWTDGNYSFTTTKSGCSDEYYEGEFAGCVNGKEMEWYCDAGEWKKRENGNLCDDDPNSNTFSCSVNPSVAEVNEDITYTAKVIPDAAYQWYKDSAKTQPITGEKSNTYETSYDSEGQYTRYVQVVYTDDSDNEVTKTAICTANVSEESMCGDKPSNRSCAPGVTTSRTYTTCNQSTGSWNYTESTCSTTTGDDKDSYVRDFYFNPDTVSVGEFCGLHLEVEDTTGCKIVDRFGNLKQTYTATADFRVSVDSDSDYGVGTYSLLCSGIGDAYANPMKKAVKSCYSKPDVQED